MSHPSNLYDPDAVAGKPKDYSKRSPQVRLGPGAYGDATTGDCSVAAAKQYAKRNSAQNHRPGENPNREYRFIEACLIINRF
jgi:hypothetical protein